MKEKVNIYTLKDPETDEVRYVGKTTRTLEKRLGEHNRHAKSYTHRCANWVKSLEKRGLQPTIELIEEVAFEDQDEREAYWISHYRGEGFDLTNLTDGGEGTSGYKWTEEAKKAKSIQMRGEKTHTNKISEAEIKNIYSRMRKGAGNKELADEYGVTRQYMYQVRVGKTWKHLYPWSDPLPASPASKPTGESHGSSKLTEADVLEIYELLRKDTPHKVVSEKYGINMSTVSNIRSGRKWAHLYDFDNPIPSKKNVAKHQGAKTPNASLTDEDVFEIYHKLADGVKNVDIAKEYNLSTQQVSNLKAGRRWKHLYNSDRNPLLSKV